MTKSRIAILHYTVPPIVGGVEAVIQAHSQAFVRAGYPVAIIAGEGEAEEFPAGVEFVRIHEMNSQDEQIVEMSAELEQGIVPPSFEPMTGRLRSALASVLDPSDTVIVHNLFTKHFNLPLTAALFQLLDTGEIQHCIAWCHDYTWTSPNSGSQVHPGYPWDLLRTQNPKVTYVVVSQSRQRELAGLFGCPVEEIRVVYNGVDPDVLLGLSAEGATLIERLNLLEQDLVLLMPVRVTHAKNIEYALRVVAALKARGCCSKLVLTGPPDPHDAESMTYFHSLQALRSDLGVEEEMRFVFESGSDPEEPHFIEANVVGDLFRVCDLMFMPSHSEGFAMPVLEAGLVGVPVVTTEVPAAVEIGGAEVMLIDRNDDPDALADRLLAWAENSPVHRLRRRVRQRYTWQAIFRREIEPLLPGEEA
jgi:glycosyltransferase involved in cell wall biosynthesis